MKRKITDKFNSTATAVAAMVGSSAFVLFNAAVHANVADDRGALAMGILGGIATAGAAATGGYRLAKKALEPREP